MASGLLALGSLPAIAAPTLSASGFGAIATAMPGFMFAPYPNAVEPVDLVATSAEVYVSDSGNDNVEIFDPDGTPVTEIGVPTPSSVGSSSDGSTVYVLSASTSSVARVATASDTALSDIDITGVAGPRDMSVSPTGPLYIISNSSTQLYGFKADGDPVGDGTPGSGQSTNNGLYSTPWHALGSLDGSKIYMTERDPAGAHASGGLRVIDSSLAANAPDLADTDIPGATGLAQTPDGHIYVGSQATGTVVELTAAGALTGRSVSVGGSPDILVPSPDGKFLYVDNRAAGQFSIVDLATFTDSGAIGTVGSGNGLAVSPDGYNLYATSTPTGTVHHYALANVGLTAPATVTPGTGVTTFHTEVSDGQSPLGDYSGDTMTVDILDSTNAVVATGQLAPDAATGVADVPVDLSALPAGTYSVRATLDPAAGVVVVTASGFTVASAASGAVTTPAGLAATGTSDGPGLWSGIGLLLAGAALLVVRRFRPTRSMGTA
jgi:DNA-binding beta-propeller fold protein YncE